MPRQVSDIVTELDWLLKEKIRFEGGDPVVTIPWRDFYLLCRMTRFKPPRDSEIRDQGRDRFGLIIAYGEKVVLVAHDRNFAEFTRD